MAKVTAKEFFTEKEILEMAVVCDYALSDYVGIHSRGENQNEEPLFQRIEEFIKIRNEEF